MRDDLTPAAEAPAAAPDATATGSAAAAQLKARLAAEAGRIDFYAALRLLEQAHPELPRIGTSLRPRDDAVRFGQEPSLAFAAATLAGFEPGSEGRRDRLLVNFIGLLGANGPLPIHLTEYARDRLRNAADPTLARFLDLFHHRMVTLFYRAWAQAQPTVSRDRPQDDRFAVYVASLIGLGQPSLRERDAVPDDAKRFFAARLAALPRNAEGLRALLAEDFGVPVRIEQYVGQWLELPVEARTRLSARAPHHGRNAQLGVSSALGTRSWQAQHKFRVRLGPLSRADYERFLPGRPALARLTDWLRGYLGDSLDWDLQLELARDQVAPLQLAGTDAPALAAAPAARLGLTSWLNGAAATYQIDRLRLAPRRVH